MFEKEKKKLAPIIEIWRRAGKQLHLVGGAVRDALLGKESHDLDLTTDALPEETKSLLARASFKVIPKGEAFGMIATILGDDEVEITTYRGDSYRPDSRKPEVVFTSSIEEDLVRRDFTVNAMAWDLLEDKLVDPFGGQRDLSVKLLRCPQMKGEDSMTAAMRSFGDDPLRMLRAARFLSKGLDFNPSVSISQAALQMADRIHVVSHERWGEEFDKLLVCEDPATGLDWLAGTGLLRQILPELEAGRGMTQNKKWHHKDVWQHTLLVVSGVPATPRLRWAALFHDVGKPVTYKITKTGIHFYRHEIEGAKLWWKIAERFKLPKKFAKEVQFLIRQHLRPMQVLNSRSDKAVRRLYFECQDAGEWAWDDLMDLSKSDCTSGKTGKRQEVIQAVEWLRERPKAVLNETVKPKLPTGLGSALCEKRGLKPGPWIRDDMAACMQAIEEGKLPTRPSIEECLVILGL